MTSVLVLYTLAAALLRPYRIVAKFGIIKIVVFLNVLYGTLPLFSAALMPRHRQTAYLYRTCFEIDEQYGTMHLSDARAPQPILIVMSLELLAYAIAFARAFPASDVESGKIHERPTVAADPSV